MTPSPDPAVRYWQTVAVHEGAHAAFAQAQVMCRLAGPEAEAKWAGRPDPVSGRHDLAEARDWAARLTLRDPRVVIEKLTRRVRLMLGGYPLWPVTLAIAGELLKAGSLSGEQAAAVYHRTLVAEAIEERVLARVQCRG